MQPKKIKLIKEAAELLMPRGVYIKSSQTDFSDAYPGIEDDHFPEHRAQSFNHVANCQFNQTDEDGKQDYLYRYLYQVGIRLVDTSIADPKDEEFVLGFIEADFEAHYSSHKQLSEEQIKTFGENNVGYHVWPFWREFVQSMSAKANVLALSIPLYTVPPISDDGSDGL